MVRFKDIPKSTKGVDTVEPQALSRLIHVSRTGTSVKPDQDSQFFLASTKGWQLTPQEWHGHNALVANRLMSRPSRLSGSKIKPLASHAMKYPVPVNRTCGKFSSRGSPTEVATGTALQSSSRSFCDNLQVTAYLNTTPPQIPSLSTVE